MASTTPSGSDDELRIENESSSFDDVINALNDSYSGMATPQEVLDNYDIVVAAYGDERYENALKESVDSVYDRLPSREAYHVADYDSIAEINESVEGDALFVALGFEASPDYGEDIPTHKEISEEGLETEGKWWDHPEEVEADILLDKASFYGAVDAPGRPEVFDMDFGSFSDTAYLFDNQN